MNLAYSFTKNSHDTHTQQYKKGNVDEKKEYKKNICLKCVIYIRGKYTVYKDRHVNVLKCMFLYTTYMYVLYKYMYNMHICTCI